MNSLMKIMYTDILRYKCKIFECCKEPNGDVVVVVVVTSGISHYHVRLSAKGLKGAPGYCTLPRSIKCKNNGCIRG